MRTPLAAMNGMRLSFAPISPPRRQCEPRAARGGERRDQQEKAPRDRRFDRNDGRRRADELDGGGRKPESQS